MNEKRLEFLLKYLDTMVGFADDGLLDDIQWASKEIKAELTEVKTAVGPTTMLHPCGNVVCKFSVDELVNGLNLRLKNMVE